MPDLLAPQPPEHSTAGPLVALRGVTKTFADGAAALGGFNLEVEPGEFVSLIGPSGCGKSTALRIIAGLSTASAGTVAVRVAPQRVGVVFQDPTLLPWASVAANVWLPLRLRGISREAARPAIDQALAMVGLADAAHRVPRQLSGGMRMRVSIARALVIRPTLLLMDEPFAALDEITRFRLNDDLLRLRRELGTTVIFVTHSVYESAYLSSRIVVMAAGPGRAVATVAIDAAEARDEAFRGTPAYLAACRAASAALHAAMGPAVPATSPRWREAG